MHRVSNPNANWRWGVDGNDSLSRKIFKKIYCKGGYFCFLKKSSVKSGDSKIFSDKNFFKK